MKKLEPEVHVYGPVAEDMIRQLEVPFGRPMPPSYRAFLARFGSINIVNSTFSGIMREAIDAGRGCAWTDTKCARGECLLPDHYLVIEPDSDGFVCLDFDRIDTDGEHPVIYHMPFRKTPFNELAPSYGVWLAESLRNMIEAWLEAE